MNTGSMDAAAMLDRHEATVGTPLRAMIEISDRCNEVCVHCYQVQGQKGELSTSHWRRALDELADIGVLILTISGGEATLRPDFLEIVEYAHQREFLVRIYTNGLRITRELAEALSALNVFEVEISVYSTRADVHDFVTGVPGSFERTLEGVRHLRAADVPVTIKTVIMSVNQDQIRDYPAFAASLGVRFSLDPGGLMPREGFDRITQSLNPDPDVLNALIHEMGLSTALMQDDSPVASDLEAATPPRAGDTPLCTAGQELHVEPNGELRPCTMLPIELGQVQGDGVRAAFESETARSMRALRWQHIHGCRDCDLSGHCRRCHATALAETGDSLGPYPSACAAARNTYARATDSELQIIAVNGRSGALGPYRRVALGMYETADDLITSEDHARAEKLGWVRRSEGGNPAPELAVRPGELVQIRRPGDKRSQHAPRLTRVPGGEAR